MTRMPLAQRQERLIEAAIEVIADEGVAAATTRAIAARAGMPLASFHYAFESHRALMAEVMSRVLRDDAEHFRIVMAPATSVVRTVEHGLNDYLDTLVDNHRRQQAVMELTFYALRNDGIEELAEEVNTVGRALVAELFTSYAEASGITYTVPVELMASQMIVITDGLTQAYLIGRDDKPLRALIPGLAASFADYVAD